MYLFHPGEKMERFEILAFKKTLSLKGNLVRC